MSLNNLFQSQTRPTTIPIPSTKTSMELPTPSLLTHLRSKGDRIALAVQSALAQYLGRRNSTNGQMFVPALRGSYIKPPFQYVVFDDQRLHHFHRSQLIGQGALNTITSALFQAGLKSRAFGFMPEECDDLREKLERENMLLPFGVTYIIPLTPLPMLASASTTPTIPDARLPKVAPLDLSTLSTDKLSVPLGVSGKGVVQMPLAKLGHTLIAGATGSGKSTWIHSALAVLLKQNTPDDLRIALIDPKRSELAPWGQVPHLFGEIAHAPDDAEKLLQSLVAEMDRRGDIFARALCRDIAGYNARVEPSERQPYLLIVVDECLDLVMSSSRRVSDLLKSLAVRGRSAGIVLWTATQHASAVEGLPRVVTLNLGSRLVFRVADANAARTAGCPGAQTISPNIPGRFLAKVDGEPMLIQSFYLADQELRKVSGQWAVGGGQKTGGLSEPDHKLLTWAMEQGGYLGIIDIGRVAKVGPREAVRIGERLEREGWLEKDNQSGRKRKTTQKAIDLLGGSVGQLAVKP